MDEQHQLPEPGGTPDGEAGPDRDPGFAPDRDDGEPAYDPDDREAAYALLQRGLELIQGRHHAQAAIVLERAARLEPGKGSILEALGRAHYMARNRERAREVFEALLEVDPSSHYGHYALGESLRKLGREREARTHLRLAVALQPSSTLYRSALRRATPPEER